MMFEAMSELSENGSSKQICSRCKGDHLVKDHHQNALICTTCGYVVEEELPNLNPEWRNYSDQEEDLSRVGPPMSVMIHDNGLSTRVPITISDARGKTIPPSRMRLLRRMQKMHRWTNLSGSDRSLNYVSSLISIMRSNLSLPRPTCERTMMIYRNAMSAGLVKGRRIEDILGASAYAACRENNTIRSKEEIAKVLGSRVSNVRNSLKILERDLNLELPRVNLTHYVMKFTRELELQDDFRIQALQLAKGIERDNCMDGKTPRSVAAAIIKTISQTLGEGLTEKDISRVSGVSRATIEAGFNEISSEFGGDPHD